DVGGQEGVAQRVGELDGAGLVDGEALGLGAAVEGSPDAQLLVGAEVEPVVDDAGLVAFQVPPDVAAAGAFKLSPEGDGDWPAPPPLGEGVVAVDDGQHRVVGGLGVPDGSEPDGADGGCDLGGFQEGVGDAVGGDDPGQPVLGLGGFAGGVLLVGLGDQDDGLVAEEQVGAGGRDVGGGGDVDALPGR